MATSILLYFLGGSQLINSMTKNGKLARNALLELAVRDGGQAVNNIHWKDVILARRIENFMMFLAGCVTVAIFAFFLSFALNAW